MGDVEVWKTISDFPDYQISNYGRYRRVTKTRKTPPFHIMAAGKAGAGYLAAFMRNYHGKRIQKYVHRLVAEYFVDNPNNLPEVNHKDNNKKNNHHSNLVWCNRSENNTYKNRVTKTHHNKVSIELVHRSGETVTVDNLAMFAEKIGVSPGMMSMIHTGLRQSVKGWRLK